MATGTHHEIVLEDQVSLVDNVSAVINNPVATYRPRVEIGIGRAEWDIACTGFGMMLGGQFCDTPGAIIGGVAAYAWARRRYPQTDT
ncbi:MAG TPA: hypothetical protein VFP21_00945 [Solirubrobacterales bacterium]|nr:hypothetical protein [Solirubrobacterales bacterium]